MDNQYQNGYDPNNNYGQQNYYGQTVAQPVAGIVEDPNKPGAGLAVTSMIMGILVNLFSCCGCFFWFIGVFEFICSVLGIVFGCISLGRKSKGTGMAVTGIILSVLSAILTIVFIIFSLTLIAEIGGGAEILERILEDPDGILDVLEMIFDE